MWKTLTSLSRWTQVFLVSWCLWASLHLLFNGTSALAWFCAVVAIVTGLVVAAKGCVRAVRNSLWGLRNKLLVSYVFIAAVPMALLLLLGGLGAYILLGQMAIYAAFDKLKERVPIETTAVHEIPAGTLDNLLPELGDVFLFRPNENVKLDPDFNVARRHVPPRANQFDIEITWFSPVVINKETAILVVRSRPSAVLGSLFGQKLDWGVDLLNVMKVVGWLFLGALALSVFLGMRITRSVTGAVYHLYVGTQQVNQGNLSHRIPVKGKDQLADLGGSFNRMTENVERLIKFEKERERLRSELQVAREVQSRLFPTKSPLSPTFEVSGACHPANMVSGDYYDYLAIGDGQIALALGDVAGKGISAALIMAAIQSLMRAQLSDLHVGDPEQIVALLNRQVYANTTPEKYATFFMGVYEESTARFTYTNAGHLPPMLIRGGTCTPLEVTGTIVGAFPVAVYEQRSITLQSGDLLVAFTDGIVEPENAYGEPFGEDRLAEILLKHPRDSSADLIARIIESVNQWVGLADQSDDMTILVARMI